MFSALLSEGQLFQRMIEDGLRGLTYVYAYIDGVGIFQVVCVCSAVYRVE